MTNKCLDMKAFRYVVLVATLLFAVGAVSAQNRFSGAVGTGAGVYLGEKSGEAVSADAVLGVLNAKDFFFGLGAGFGRRFILNSQYDPTSADDWPAFEWDFRQPRILKGNEFSLFLDGKFFFGDGRVRPTVEARGGLAIGYSAYTIGGVFYSLGAGCRFALTPKTGIAVRAFYEKEGGFHADDVYRSELGWFHSLGLRLAYEF